jgi:hypothetical protein
MSKANTSLADDFDSHLFEHLYLLSIAVQGYVIVQQVDFLQATITLYFQ